MTSVVIFIVCFGKPVLCTGSQKETLALSCFLCLTAFGRKNKATRFTGGSLLSKMILIDRGNFVKIIDF